MIAHFELIREISRNRSIVRKSKTAVVAKTLTAALILSGAAVREALATDFTADVVMEKMDANDRYPYISGIVEGLAYARFQHDNEHLEGDKKTTVGMKCIYDWFYEKQHALDLIYLAFGKYPTYTPGAIISNLIKQDCG